MIAFPTTEAYIEAAERELGVRLPHEYRVRLMTRNGGVLSTAGDDWKVFPVFDPTVPKTTTGPSINIVLETKSARRLDGFPPDAVAIASNGGGDLLVFMAARASGRLDPQVHRWDHETRKCRRAALRYED